MSDDITKSHYRDDVRSIAQDIFDRAMEDAEGNVDDIHDEWTDWVHEDVDGSQWVIYTHRAMLVVTQYSDNNNHGPDEMGWSVFADGATGWSDLFTLSLIHI